MLDLPKVVKPNGFPANAPGAALYFLYKDPGVGPDDFADVGDHRLGDVLDHLGCLAPGKLAFKDLDRDKWHDVVL